MRYTTFQVFILLVTRCLIFRHSAECTINDAMAFFFHKLVNSDCGQASLAEAIVVTQSFMLHRWQCELESCRSIDGGYGNRAAMQFNDGFDNGKAQARAVSLALT